MKRKHVSSPSEDPKLKQTKVWSQDETCSFTQIPTSIHGNILHYLTEEDGANFILTNKQLFYPLYSNHNLFLSSRLNKDLNNLYSQLEEIPQFKRQKLNLSKKEATLWEKRNFSFDLILSERERGISLTTSESRIKIGQIDEKLQARRDMLEKIKDWNLFLDNLENQPLNNSEISQLLETQLFNKIFIKTNRTDSTEERITYSAKIVLDQELVIRFDGESEEENLDKTNWEIHVGKIQFAKQTKGNVKLSHCDEVRKLLFGLNHEMVSNKLLLDALLIAMPFAPCMDCVKYKNIKE